MRFRKISPFMAVVFILALLMSACQAINLGNGSAIGAKAAQAGFSDLQLGQTRFFGNVASIENDRIKVDDVVFRVDSNSHIPKTLNIGDAVAVNALLLPDQSRYAVSLISANEPLGNVDATKLAFKLYGRVDGMGGQTWIVSNEIIETHPDTAIDSGISLTSLVKVEGSLADGVLLADSIKLDSQLPGYPLGTVTIEPAEMGTPAVISTPVVIKGNEIEFFGALESNSGNSWTVAGRMVLIVPQTEIKGNLVVGDFVKVEAWQQLDGSFIAHEIEKKDQSGSELEGHDGEISGLITGISENSFLVAGVLVLANGFTEINGDLKIGDYVEVEGLLQADGSILASEIDLKESTSIGSDDDSNDGSDDDMEDGSNTGSDDGSDHESDDHSDDDSNDSDSNHGDHDSDDDSHDDYKTKN